MTKAQLKHALNQCLNNIELARVDLKTVQSKIGRPGMPTSLNKSAGELKHELDLLYQERGRLQKRIKRAGK